MLEGLLNLLSRLRGSRKPEKPRRTLYVTRVPMADGSSVKFLAYDPVSGKGGRVEANVLGLVDALEKEGYGFSEAPEAVNVGYGDAPREVRQMFSQMLGGEEKLRKAMVLNRGDYGRLIGALVDRAKILREAAARQSQARKPDEGSGAAALRRGIEELGGGPDRRKRK